jgi:2-dehydro-3-deoxyphosphooctonate aldolase (KDO 8-P synthase)
MEEMTKKNVTIKNFSIGKGQPLAIMCGPCVIEDADHCMASAEFLKKLFDKIQINLVFKSSYDKANRSSYHSFRGPGIDEGLRILEKVKKELDLPIVTDIHTCEEARAASAVCDVLQIPAFLCRQTDLVVAAAQTGRVINVKKGQFVAPWNMDNVVDKIRQAGNENIILTDRGTSFGYNNLVSDMRAIPVMQRFGYPVCFDATHSVQLPGAAGHSTGGEREFIPVLAKAAVAVGADCLFIEAHPNPKEAKSDAASVIDFKELPEMLDQLNRLYQFIRQ